MCNCIEEINKKLAPEHYLNTTMSFRAGEASRPIIGLIRRDQWKLETRRNKPTSFLASFCPWCGEKYVDDHIARASEPVPQGADEAQR